MAAAPCPALIQQGGPLQEFGEATLPPQASIDSTRSIGSAATLDLPAMTPLEWCVPYLPVRNQSIPSRTYSPQRCGS